MKVPFFFLFWFLLLIPGGTKAQHFLAITTDTPGTQQNDPYRSRHFMVQGIPDLTVLTPSGDIEVIYNPAIEGVKVDLYVKRGFSIWSGSQSLDNYRIIFRQNGNAITASVERKQPASGFFGSDDVKFNFVVQSPRKITTNLRSMSGKVLLNGVEGRQFLQSDAGELNLMNSEGELSLYSAAGSIYLDNNSGQIQAKSMAGDVHINNNRGDIRVRTVSGSVWGKEMAGSFVCATVSGGVDVSFDQVRKGIQLETVSGNIILELDNPRGFDVKAQAMRVNNNLPEYYITERSSGSRATTIKLGEGGIPINISSISGTVDIKQKDN